MIINFGYRVFLREEQLARRVSLFITKEERGKTYLLNRAFVWMPLEDGEMCPEPTFSLAPEMLQPLSDALFKMGIQPQGRRFHDEQKLLTNHLEDMRKLVFCNVDKQVKETKGKERPSFWYKGAQGKEEKNEEEKKLV